MSHNACNDTRGIYRAVLGLSKMVSWGSQSQCGGPSRKFKNHQSLHGFRSLVSCHNAHGPMCSKVFQKVICQPENSMI